MAFKNLVLVAYFGMFVAYGCSFGPTGPPRIETTPLTGIVHVDGEPAVAMTVECHPSSDDSPIKHSLTTTTDTEGRFAVGMYEAGDGLPEGTYNMAFIWPKIMMPDSDQLKGKYADPGKSTIKVTVVKGKPTDMGVIELTMKKEK